MGRHREVNPIDVVEAAYDLESNDQDWLRNLASTLRPLLDGGRGLVAYYFDARTPAKKLFAKAELFDIGQDETDRAHRWAVREPAFVHHLHTHSDGLLSMMQIIKRMGVRDLAKEMPHTARYYADTNIRDFVALQTVEPGDKGIVISAPQLQPRHFDARIRRMWSRVIIHIAAGRRMREAITGDGARIEAIFDPSGKVQHVEGDTKPRSARDSLRDAVRRVEKARGKQRKLDPEGATEAWTAMVSGRWSLVDRFERDGRRYIVARRNEHMLTDPRALTQRERAIAHLAALGKSNKLIGYELGLSESTVGSHLSQVMRKLGAKTRVELIQLVTRLARPR